MGILAGGFVLLLIIGMIGAMVGDGTLHFVVPAGRKIEVTANGEKLALEALENQTFSTSLAQGSYAVAVKDLATGNTHSVPVEVGSGADTWIIPIDAEQCFARIDPTEMVYAKKSEKSKREPSPPKLVSKHPSNVAFESPSGAYRHFDQLPEKISENAEVELLTQVPCELLSQPDPVVAITTLALSGGGGEIDDEEAALPGEDGDSEQK